jgi:pyruvate dehydrogenase E2 component (dihydrolipoamide acetyltransferase)
MLCISPRAAALAGRSAIDPAAIKGSGPMGRVVERDVKEALDARGDQSVPMTKMRQIIAQRLTQSFRDIPHFYVTVSVDMTGLAALREQLKASGSPCTITDFISQAVVLSLVEFPGVNSSTDGVATRRHSHVNLGLAVSVPGGLVVPVIHRAGSLTLREISAASRQLADKARAGKLTPDDMSGGTFTISNMGMLNVENFSAIINPGEGAILAVATAFPQPVAREGGIFVRQMMKMTLSVDHRLVDGAAGAQFINAIKSKLEDAALWKGLAAK